MAANAAGQATHEIKSIELHQPRATANTKLPQISLLEQDVFMATSLLVFCGRNESYSMDILIDSCKSGTYLTIDSLYDYCKVPGECRRKYESEGKIALIKGFIDYLTSLIRPIPLTCHTRNF